MNTIEIILSVTLYIVSVGFWQFIIKLGDLAKPRIKLIKLVMIIPAVSTVCAIGITLWYWLEIYLDVPEK